jgi:hypothetical protein
MSSFCTSCGNAMRGSSFCTSCGAVQTVVSSDSSAASAVDTSAVLQTSDQQLPPEDSSHGFQLSEDSEPKGKKKVLETTEKSREMQGSSTLEKAAPAKEPETAPSMPDAAEESAVDCCAICLTGLEPTERAFVFEGCRCRSCVCAACQFANDAHARTHTHHKTQTQTNKNTHTHIAGMRSTASALDRG